MDYEPNCLHCGGPLTGRQRRACSPRCRKALQRGTRPLRTCKLCRQPFMPAGPGQPSVCPYEDADDFCQGLQNDAEDAEATRQALRQAATCQGPSCDQPLPYAGRGRPPRFCGPVCRTRTYRQEARS